MPESAERERFDYEALLQWETFEPVLREEAGLVVMSKRVFEAMKSDVLAAARHIQKIEEGS